MDVLDGLQKRDIRNLLGKGWLTHDGLWFYHACRELGVERANGLNRAAIRSLAPIEVARAKKILGVAKERFDAFDDLMAFLQAVLDLTLPDSISRNIHFSSPSKNSIQWNWEKGQCFAYKGIKQMGRIDTYQCGVMYRIECWLDALGIRYSIHPKITRCLMHETGTCEGQIRVLPAAGK